MRIPGLVLRGPLSLRGVHDASSRDPQATPDAWPLRPGLLIRRAVWQGGRLTVDCTAFTGPGDEPEITYALSATDLRNGLRASSARTLRAWLGLYPRAYDRVPGAFGPGRREYTMAQLNMAAPA